MKNERVMSLTDKTLLSLIYVSCGLLSFNLLTPIGNALITYDSKRFVSLAIVSLLAFLTLLSTRIKVCTTPSRFSRVLGVNLLTGMLYSLLSGVFVMPLAIFWSSIKPDLIQKRRVAGWSHALLTLLAVSILISTSYIGYKRVEFYRSQIVAEDLVFENVAIQLWVGNNCLR